MSNRITENPQISADATRLFAVAHHIPSDGSALVCGLGKDATMAILEKPRKYKDNGYLTSSCKHGKDDVCDFCFRSLADHQGMTDREEPIKRHRFEKSEGGDVFVCASCK